MKLLLIDDHPLLRESLALRVRASGKDSVSLIEADSCEQAVALCNEHRPDLMLLDLSFPGIEHLAAKLESTDSGPHPDALLALLYMRECVPGIPIVVLSSEERPSVIRAAIRLGAVGFIPKSSSFVVFQRALDLVLANGIYLPPAVLADLEFSSAATGSRVGTPAPPAPLQQKVSVLTARQRDTYTCVLSGMQGGVATTAGYRLAFMVAAPSNLIPLSLNWLVWGEGKSMILALLPLLLGAMLMSFATQYEQLVRRRFAEESEKNRALAALEQEKAELQRARDAANEAFAAAREANHAKSRFLAAASHDLRQPLHALMLFLGSLESHVHGDEARALHRRVSYTASVLEEQFNSLLDLSKFDADVVKPELTVFRFDTLLAELAQEFGPQARQKGLALAGSAPAVMVRTDLLLIERLLRNLLSNAVRFTDRSSVTMICEATGAGLRVAVVDTGPGIAADDHDKVFAEFVQLDNSARRRDKGVGLGLAIARRISNLLELGLTLTSTVGLGSRFEFVVPMVNETAQQNGATADPGQVTEDEATLAGLRVLIVEDDPLVCEAMGQQFQSWGVKAMFVESLEEVRAIAQAGAPIDVALIDDMLGKSQTGLQIAQWLSGEFPALRIAPC